MSQRSPVPATREPARSEAARCLAEFNRLRLPKFAPRQGSGPLVFALEGPNGAGKTTLARRLTRSLGASVCLGTPPAWFSRPFKARMIRDADWFASAMFFLSGCFEQMRALRTRSAPWVLLDRCLWSTLAVHAATDPERLTRLLLMLRPIATRIRVPDVTIVLEASFATCLARIGRKETSAQALDRLTANAAFHAREHAFYQWLARQTPTVQFLNVDQATAPEAAELARRLIEPKLQELKRAKRARNS